MNCERFLVFFVDRWGGHKSRHFTMFHMCKTWLKKVHGGWEMGGGVILNKKNIYKIHWI